jgi:DNA polymerase-3 subunit epsilon
VPSFALIDFETTGLSPDLGDRPTEIAVLIVRDGVVAERFSSLMNPERGIPREVQVLTGITPAMVARAPSIATVMNVVREKVGSLPLVAHNAAFDRRFWRAEALRLGSCNEENSDAFACTMLLARRLYPEARSHTLGTLVALHRLPMAKAHRAQADVEMTFALWQKMNDDVRSRFGVSHLSFALMQALQKAKREQLAAAVERYLHPKSAKSARQKRSLAPI